jgi:hypothetical protein
LAGSAGPLAPGEITEKILINGDPVLGQVVNGIGRMKIGSPEVLIDPGDIMTITGRKRVKRPLKTASNARAEFRKWKVS